VKKALQLMNDFKLSHLPVVSEETYLGLISEDDLMDADDEKMPVGLLEEHFMDVFVYDNVHFLTVINTCNQFETSVVPVIHGARELAGVINSQDLMKWAGNFCGAGSPGGMVVMEMNQNRFSISEIARIIENNDCTLLHLNTQSNPLTGILTVTIQVNKKEIAALIASFERYEYEVIYYFGNEKFDNEIRSNYDHLLNYLNI
jgi:CBS domain-containing protein